VAVAPDGAWLAAASDGEGKVRIWDTSTWQQQVQMRVDGLISTCTWLGAKGLVAGGTAGLYLFDFLH
jgi:WD40 repeat protein